jgi:hypothetical protein
MPFPHHFPSKMLRLALTSLLSAAALAQTAACAKPAPTTEDSQLPNGYSSPPLRSDKVAVKQFSWNGHEWNNDSGQAWNAQVPYAIGISNDRIRFEIRDTTNDRGQVDPPHKRRAEISSKGKKFRNHVGYWMAYSFKTHWSCVPCQVQTGAGHESMQVHWPSGASPPLAFRIVPYMGAAAFRVTTRGEGQENIDRYTGPIALDRCHDVVFHFQLGAQGFAEIWLDGRQVANLHGIPVGTDNEDGYAMRFGPYSGELGGNVVVSEYSNIGPFPSTVDLSARIRRPPPC